METTTAMGTDSTAASTQHSTLFAEYFKYEGKKRVRILLKLVALRHPKVTCSFTRRVRTGYCRQCHIPIDKGVRYVCFSVDVSDSGRQRPDTTSLCTCCYDHAFILSTRGV